MPTFVVLGSFTAEGIQNVKETIERSEAFKELAKKSGVTVKDMYWPLGRHDIVAPAMRPTTSRDGADAERRLARVRPLRDAARLLL